MQALPDTVSIMSFEPYIRRYTPPSTTQIQEIKEHVDGLRAQREEERAALAPLRRRILKETFVKDLDAALACQCSCHPSVSALHDTGSSCPCQLTPEQQDRVRAQALAHIMALSDEFSQDNESRIRRLSQAVDEACEALRIQVHHYEGLAPFVVRGEVDGRGFCLRERHDAFTVTIAPDDDPTADPWTLDASRPVIVVAEGSSNDWPSNDDTRFVLELVAHTVRLFLLRRECLHPQATRFCPDCGVEAGNADKWRITTSSPPDPA